MQCRTNDTLNWLLQQKSTRRNPEPPHVLDLFRRHIAASLDVLPRQQPTTRVAVSEFTIPDTEEYLPVARLAAGIRAIAPSFVDVLVFSSVATGDTVRYWSDLDVLAIVKAETLQDEKAFWNVRERLQVLEEELYRFDPWQHHGIQYVTEYDLQFFPEFFLPLAVIEQAASLLGAVSLNFAVRDSRREEEARLRNIHQLFIRAAHTGTLHHHARNGVYLTDNFATAADNFYQFKYFVSVVLMLPSYYLALVEGPVYKRDSFERISQYFPPEQLELVRACENVRALFASVRPHENAIPPEVVSVLGQNYFERAERLAHTLLSDYEKRQLAAAA